MTINYQFGDVDAHGATIRAQAASLEASTRPSSAMCWPPGTFGVVPGRPRVSGSSPSWAGHANQRSRRRKRIENC